MGLNGGTSSELVEPQLMSSQGGQQHVAPDSSAAERRKDGR